jgi:hypothetical protein
MLALRTLMTPGSSTTESYRHDGFSTKRSTEHKHCRPYTFLCNTTTKASGNEMVLYRFNLYPFALFPRLCPHQWLFYHTSRLIPRTPRHATTCFLFYPFAPNNQAHMHHFLYHQHTPDCQITPELMIRRDGVGTLFLSFSFVHIA